MTVEIRQAGGEWFVEVRGVPIGYADSAGEAQALAEFWRGRLECIARWRRQCRGKEVTCLNHSPGC